MSIDSINRAVDSKAVMSEWWQMNIEQLEIKGRDYTRTAWLLPGPKQKHPICIVLDGEHYQKSMNALSIFKESMETGHIPKMSFSFPTMAPSRDMRIIPAMTVLRVMSLKTLFPGPKVE